MRRIKFLLLLWALLSLPVIAVSSGKSNAELERQIKATYLYKFTSFVEWPAATFTNATAPFLIACIGADEIADELKSIAATNQVQNRLIEVSVYKVGETIPPTHVLFIGKKEQQNLKRILSGVQAKAILAVTETDGAMEAGAIINFFVADDKVRFEVSQEQAERNGLKISSRLLNVARKTEGRR